MSTCFQWDSLWFFQTIGSDAVPQNCTLHPAATWESNEIRGTVSSCPPTHTGFRWPHRNVRIVADCRAKPPSEGRRPPPRQAAFCLCRSEMKPTQTDGCDLFFSKTDPTHCTNCNAHQTTLCTFDSPFSESKNDLDQNNKHPINKGLLNTANSSNRTSAGVRRCFAIIFWWLLVAKGLPACCLAND